MRRSIKKASRMIPAKTIHPILRREGRRSEEHTSELQSLRHLVCRLLLEKKKKRGTACFGSPNPHEVTVTNEEGRQIQMHVLNDRAEQPRNSSRRAAVQHDVQTV